MPSTPVLDLTHDSGGNTTDALRVVRATAVGEHFGYRLEAQRRAQHGHKRLAIRITDPTGRELNLLTWLSRSASDAKSPVSSALGRSVALIFRNELKPAQAETMRTTIAAVMDAGLRCLAEGITGAQADTAVQCAAEGIDPAVVQRWRDAFTSAVPPIREIRWLHEAGFTAEEAAPWFPHGVHVGTATQAQAIGEFRRNGWTAEQYLDFKDLHDRIHRWGRIDAQWARLSAPDAILSVRAGFTARETTRMVRAGEWHEDTMLTLAALREGPTADPAN